MNEQEKPEPDRRLPNPLRDLPDDHPLRRIVGPGWRDPFKPSNGHRTPDREEPAEEPPKPPKQQGG